MEEEKFKPLFLELAALPSEAEWIEVKQNNDNPEEIGQYISALSNSAALCCKPRAYLLWGIDDRSHQIVGTTFRPRRAKVGNRRRRGIEEGFELRSILGMNLCNAM